MLIILNMWFWAYIYVCVCIEREEREFPQSRQFLVTFSASHLSPALFLFTQGESGLCALSALEGPGTGNLSRWCQGERPSVSWSWTGKTGFCMRSTWAGSPEYKQVSGGFVLDDSIWRNKERKIHPWAQVSDRDETSMINNGMTLGWL